MVDIKRLNDSIMFGFIQLIENLKNTKEFKDENPKYP